MEEIVSTVVANGLWAVLFCGLLVYELRDSRKRESRYTSTISSLSERLGTVNAVKSAVAAVGTEVSDVKTAAVGIKSDTAEIKADIKKLASGADVEPTAAAA